MARHGPFKLRSTGMHGLESIDVAGSRVRLFALAALLCGAACGRSPSAEGQAKRVEATVIPNGLPLRKLWDWHGIIGTGQSLSVGAEGLPVRSTTVSYRNLKLDL